MIEENEIIKRIKMTLEKEGIRKFKRYNDLVDFVDGCFCDKSINFITKLYWIIHDMDDYPKCSYCGKDITRNVINLNKGYIQVKDSFDIYCNGYCAAMNTKEIRKKTCIEKYGTEHHLKNKEIIEKRKRHTIEKYGVDSVSKLDSWKDKYKQICNEKYGVDNVFQSEEVKNKIKETCLEKYGTEYATQSNQIKEKIKNTCLEKYGVDSISKSDEWKESFKRSCIKKFGSTCPLGNSAIKEKIILTNIDRYGCLSPMQNKDVCDKYKNIIRKKYGCDYPLQSLDVQKKRIQNNVSKYGCGSPNSNDEMINHNLKRRRIQIYNQKILKDNNFKPVFSIDDFLDGGFKKPRIWKCKRCEKIVESEPEKYPFCKNCDSFYGSQIEKIIYDFLKELNVDFVYNSRQILPSKKQLDFYLPSKNIAIEVDGLYWHCDGIVPKDYQINKTIECFNENIELIHIFEDEILNKLDNVKSYIKKKLGMIKEIDLVTIDISTDIDFCEKFIKENSLNYSVDILDSDKLYLLKNNIDVLSIICIRNNQIVYWSENKQFSVSSSIYRNIFSKIGNVEFFMDNRWPIFDKLNDIGFIKDEMTDIRPWYIKSTARFDSVDDPDHCFCIWDCGQTIFHFKQGV